MYNVPEDLLLHIITARNIISWQNFKGICDFLACRESAVAPSTSPSRPIGSIANKRTIVVRLLDSLGHVNIHSDNWEIAAAPALLARLPHAGFPRAILAGGRSPSTISEIANAIGNLNLQVCLYVDRQNSPFPFLPARVCLRAESPNDIMKIAEYLHIPYLDTPPAWSIVHFAQDIIKYTAACQWTQGEELNWRRVDFDPQRLSFGCSHSIKDKMRLARYTDPIRGIFTHYLWLDGQRAKVEPDWGRYAVLRTQGKQIFCFDRRNLVVAIPTSAPLPKLLARSLTACSGYTPLVTSRTLLIAGGPICPCSEFLIYRHVPMNIAEIVATKVGQDITPIQFDSNLLGEEND